MKTINAIWEKKNTGFKTCELEFKCEDTINDYLNNNIEKDYDFIVAKVPTNNIVLLHKLEDNGYRFMETQFTICSIAKEESERIDQKWNRFITGTSYKKIDNKDDLEFLLENIQEGMFTYDRISLDEKFGKEISSRRYINWILDIFEENKSEIFMLEKNSTKVGFFIINEVDKNVLQSTMGGIFNKYIGKGLSIAMIYYCLKIAVDRNVRSVITSFSSNNQNMLNTFTKIVSFRTLKISYVLRKFVES
jgi:hypothetical protein